MVYQLLTNVGPFYFLASSPLCLVASLLCCLLASLSRRSQVAGLKLGLGGYRVALTIIIPRPRGSEPGSRPTRDYEGLQGTTKKERRAQLENGGHRDYIGLGRTAKQEADYKRSRGTTWDTGATRDYGRRWRRDCREDGEDEGLQGTMAAYSGPAGSDPCGLQGILLFLPRASFES